MKKQTSIMLSLVMVLTMIFTMSPFSLADEVDTTTSATVTGEGGSWSGSTTYDNTAIPTGAETYTVKLGDFFWKIARAHGFTTDELKALNPQIKNYALIFPGQKVIVKAAAVETPAVEVSGDLSIGSGLVTNFRERSGGKNSFNVTTANAVFDADGKIVDLKVDVLEVSQSSGFVGWPTEDGTVTAEMLTEAVAGWQTKRERGDAYNMASKATSGNEWYEQMNYFEDLFVGMTVEEVRAWFDKNTDVNGRPIKPLTAESEEDLAKLALLTDAEKEALVDVVTSATMSLSDSHSLIIEAIEEAYANRLALNIK